MFIKLTQYLPTLPEDMDAWVDADLVCKVLRSNRPDGCVSTIYLQGDGYPVAVKEDSAVVVQMIEEARKQNVRPGK